MSRASGSRALLVFACSFLLGGIAFLPAASGAEKTEEDARPNSLEAGSWSLQFQITDQFGLQPFDGMMVSLKRHWSRRSALRLGVQVSAEGSSSTNSYWQEVADTLLGSNGQDADRSYQKFTVDLSYLRYPWPGSQVNFFWGIGPLVSFSRDDRTETSDYSSQGRVDHRSTHSYQRTWALGAVGLVGVEWFLSKHFSFHSEYRASISYGRSISTTEDYRSYMSERTSRGTETDGWNVRSAYATLGLSVYF
jgi:hypothetical protein